MEQEKKKKVIGILSTIVTVLLVFFASIITIRNVCFTGIVVFGSSMAPTLNSGDFGYALTTNYAKNHLDRFDIIIFEYEDNGKKKDLVKRLIAFPGESFTFKNDDCDLYIGEEYVKQDFISLEYQKLTCDGPLSAIDREVNYQVPDDCYFVLGDNRGNSKDSAHGLGYIPKDDVVGVLKMITATCTIDEEKEVCEDKKLTTFRFF